jgi:hypothetical protein
MSQGIKYKCFSLILLKISLNLLCNSLVVGYCIDKDEGMASKSSTIAEISERIKVSKP